MLFDKPLIIFNIKNDHLKSSAKYPRISQQAKFQETALLQDQFISW